MLTVLLASRNGARTLPAVLTAFSQLKVPEGGWKLVVVDNASTDGTGAILRDWATRLPLTCLHEPRLGKNVALNTGLNHASPGLVVLTDDDVIPGEGWLTAYERAARSCPEYTLFGGPVVPMWEIRPAPWIESVPQGPAFSVTVERAEGPMAARAIFGPNMAIRSTVFESGYRFNESIGPRGVQYAMGSETELLLRLAADGHKAWHVPAAGVEHIVRRHQMTKRWVLRRAERYGRGQYLLSSDPSESRLRVLTGTIRPLGRACFKAGWAALRKDEVGLVQQLWKVRFFAGWARQALTSNERWHR